MDVFEITGYQTGVSRAGVNYLQPSDSFQEIENGFVYRQVLQSRKGFTQFSSGRLSDGSRVMGIFEFLLQDNTTELLAITFDYLYKYNEGTNTFDQITNNASTFPGAFGISSNRFYVSGTSYPDKNGNDRFVFTGIGMQDVLFYDQAAGDVKSFTGDNADYQAPAQGPLTKAWFVINYGGRLTLYQPTVNGLPYPQGVLYSAIRDGSGNGDKFNSVGAGLLSADTGDYINGAKRLGDVVISTFSRSTWALEKTSDAFNPFAWRKIPGVLGTDAPFSPVAWDTEVKSLGKTGILETDARVSKRIDDKIPASTRSDISQEFFALTYGGFDRNEGQFLFAYKQNEGEPDLDTQDRVLVNNYEERTWSVNTQRFSVFGETELGQALTWNEIDETNDPSWITWDTTDEIWNEIGLSNYNQKTLAGDDEGFIYKINTDYDDYVIDITGITQAANAVVSTGDQAFKEDDRVGIQLVEGMTQVNNFDIANTDAKFEAYTVLSATTNSITLDVDTQNFAAYTQGGIVSKLIAFSAKTIPFNPYRDQGRKVFISHVEFLIDSNNGFVKVEMFADEEPQSFKEAVLCQPTTVLKAREWITVIVNNEASFISFKMSQESLSSQVKITNMRIHARAGGLVSG